MLLRILALLGCGINLCTGSTTYTQVTTIGNNCRCSFPFSYGGIEWTTCTATHQRKHTTSGAITAVWCMTQNQCGHHDPHGDFYYDECPHVAIVPMPPPPPPPPGVPTNHLCCARSQCDNVAEYRCGRQEEPGRDACGTCAHHRGHCSNYYRLNSQGVSRPCVWNKDAFGGNGTCEMGPRDGACSASTHHASQHGGRQGENHPAGAESSAPASPSPASSQSPSSESSTLYDGTSPAIVVIAALLVGLGVSGTCWCALRALNRCAGGVQTTGKQRLHDEGETPKSRPSRSSASEAELELVESATGEDEPSAGRAGGPKRKGKKGRKGERGPVLWHDEEDVDEAL